MLLLGSLASVAAGEITLDPDEGALQIFAEKIRRTVVGKEAADLVQEAFDKKDLELLRLCWESPKSGVYFMGKFKEEPPSDFKNSLVLIMMRSAWSWDEIPNQAPAQGSRGVPVGAFLCVEAIAKYLPEENLIVGDRASVDRLFKPFYRFELADKFEAALKKADKKEDAPTSVGDDSAISVPNTAVAPATTLPVASFPVVQSTPEAGDSSIYWVTGLIVSAVGIFVRFVLRKPKQSS